SFTAVTISGLRRIKSPLARKNEFCLAMPVAAAKTRTPGRSSATAKNGSQIVQASIAPRSKAARIGRRQLHGNDVAPQEASLLDGGDSEVVSAGGAGKAHAPALEIGQRPQRRLRRNQDRRSRSTGFGDSDIE